MVLESVTIHLLMHLKYCFKILLAKLNLKYYINCVIYVSKILKDNTEMASCFGIMFFFCLKLLVKELFF